ncbi:MAG: 50S ribosomal protein L20 [Patescibacteria group bacterium]|jgi:large subunit ribosomal protein L20
MARVKRGMISRKRHKNLLALTKGYRGTRNNLIRMAKQATLNAGIFAYRDRRNKKRDFRSQWITTINIALQNEGVKYSQFIHQLTIKKIDLNRKALAEMAEKQPEAFTSLVKQVMN